MHAIGVGLEYRLLEGGRLRHALFYMTGATLHFLGVLRMRQLCWIDVGVTLGTPQVVVYRAMERLDVHKHTPAPSMHIEAVEVGLAVTLLTGLYLPLGGHRLAGRLLRPHESDYRQHRQDAQQHDSMRRIHRIPTFSCATVDGTGYSI